MVIFWEERNCLHLISFQKLLGPVCANGYTLARSVLVAMSPYNKIRKKANNN
jgi:hypothetical protein